MRSFQTVMAILFVAVLATGCGLKQADYATANETINPDAVQIWHAPIIAENEMSTQKVTGYSGKSYILGIPIKGDASQGENAWVYDNVGRRQLKGLASVAAGRAIDDVNADGLYITRVTAERDGLVPFFYTIDYTVKGYPVTLKQTQTIEPALYWKSILQHHEEDLRTAPQSASAVGGILSFFKNFLPF